MADASTAVIVLACVQSVSTIALVGVTAFYARVTAKISSAAQRQADATMQMAQTMYEQALPRANF